MITNITIPLRPGADSFKRLLGCGSFVHRIISPSEPGQRRGGPRLAARTEHPRKVVVYRARCAGERIRPVSLTAPPLTAARRRKNYFLIFARPPLPTLVWLALP